MNEPSHNAVMTECKNNIIHRIIIQHEIHDYNCKCNHETVYLFIHFIQSYFHSFLSIIIQSEYRSSLFPTCFDSWTARIIWVHALCTHRAWTISQWGIQCAYNHLLWEEEMHWWHALNCQPEFSTFWERIGKLSVWNERILKFKK